VKTDPTFWVAARASGLTAYTLLSCSVLAGLVLKSRPFGSLLRPATVTDLHRFLALLALGATATHGIALVLDSTVTVTWRGLVVPGVIAYRPVWTGVGVVTAELIVLIYVSFSVRKWIGAKNWRRLHWATYGAFGSATVHGLMSGSDSDRAWVIGLYLGAIAAVVAATAWRALVPPGKPGRVPRAQSGPRAEVAGV
jgi:methionine sulfoxide reductase heme-binding subunit